MSSYNEALYYYEKEYELIKDVPKEAFNTLYNIAETLFLAKKPYDQVEKACLDARNAVSYCNLPSLLVLIQDILQFSFLVVL